MKDETDHSDSDESSDDEYTDLQGLVSASKNGRIRSSNPVFNLDTGTCWDAEREAVTIQNPSAVAAFENERLEGNVRGEFYNAGTETLAFNDATLASNVVACQTHDPVLQDLASKLTSVQLVPDYDIVNMSSGLSFNIDSSTGRFSAGAAFETNELVDQSSYPITVEKEAIGGQASGLLCDESLSYGIGHMGDAARLVDQTRTISLSSGMSDAFRTDVLQAGPDNGNYLTEGHGFANDNLTLLGESQMSAQSMMAGVDLTTASRDIFQTESSVTQLFQSDTKIWEREEFTTHVSQLIDERLEMRTSSSGIHAQKLRNEITEIESKLKRHYASVGERTQEIEDRLSGMRSELMQIKSDLGEQRFQESYTEFGLGLIQLGMMFVNPAVGVTLTTAVKACQMVAIYGEEYISGVSE